MTDREKLIELLIGAGNAVADKYLENMGMSYAEQKRTEADYLISHGVTITPAVPGPSEDDRNIMELCFRNGERHMKERILTKLKDFSAEIMFEQRITGEVKVATFEQVIQILEDL